MNHCRRCDSDYDQPGTCNCFAPAPPAPTITVPEQPNTTWIPMPYVAPPGIGPQPSWPYIPFIY